MRTGTRTVFAVSLMTSAPATICGRFSLTESRTFSSCLSQSRAPRENSSYHLVRPEGLLPLRSSIASYRRALRRGARAFTLLLCKQCRHVAQRLLGTVLVITVLTDQPLLNNGNLLPGVFVRPCRGRHQSQHIAAFFEQILLDRLTHARVARQLELLACLEANHGLADHFLAEGQLAGVRNLDLLLDRTQEALVRRPRLVRDGVG